jgi:hypothetical protein
MTSPRALHAGVALCFALGLPSAACTSGLADDASDVASDISAAPITESDLLGLYDPTNGPLRNPQITDWAGSPLLKGGYIYDGDLFPVSYVLEPGSDAAHWTGQSSIAVQYGPNRCDYAVEIQVNVTRDTSGEVNLYVRDNTPGSIPRLLPVGAPCPQLQNVWHVHPRPYVKRGPGQVFAGMLDALCDDITARIGAVEAGKRLAAGPMGDVPPNIYAASGDWQALSTPGRDQQLRDSIRRLHSFVETQTTGSDAHDRAAQLLGIWNQHQATCRLEYKNSNHASVPFTLNDVQSRLFDLSFDPYHCTEMRWGAYPTNMAEYASCNTQSDAHTKRFKDEKSLRNMIDRPAAGTPTPLGSGPAEHADIDVPALLHRLTGS